MLRKTASQADLNSKFDQLNTKIDNLANVMAAQLQKDAERYKKQPGEPLGASELAKLQQEIDTNKRIAENALKTAEQSKKAATNATQQAADAVRDLANLSMGTPLDPPKQTLNPAFRLFTAIAPDLERLQNGALNFEAHNLGVKEANLTLRKIAIRTFFPKMVLDCAAPVDILHAMKNKIVFPKELRITRADSATLYKLERMQVLLKQALIPYDNWALRVAQELDGDFQQLANWAESLLTVTWTLFVEDIIQVLHSHKVELSSLTAFTSILPFKDEVYHNFAWRIRDCFYKLSRDQQAGAATRQVLLDKLRNYLPSLFAEIQRYTDGMSTPQIIEDMVRSAKLHDHKAIESSIYSTPSATVQLQGQTAPFYDMSISAATPTQPGHAQIKPRDAAFSSISDPRQDTREVFTTGTVEYSCGTCGDLFIGDSHCGGFFVGAAFESSNKCYNCGKLGHWAKDCRLPPKFPKNTTASVDSRVKGESVTIKGDMFKNTRSSLTGKVKQAFQRGGKFGNKPGPKVHFVEPERDDDEQALPSVADRLAGVDDDDLRWIIEEQLRDEAANLSE